MKKFSREALSKTAAGKIIENEKQLLLHDQVQEKKKKIAAGYEHGWIIINNDRPMFVRSRWECNLVFYFEFLKTKGAIKNWFYEEKTFWFEGIRRGITNYKPDFRIVENDGSEYWIEVKGYFTQKDHTKMMRMKKYYPDVRIKILSSDKGLQQIHEKFPSFSFEKYASYDLIAESKDFIKGWGSPFKKKEEVQHLIPLPMKKPVARKKKQNNLLF